MVTDLNFQGRAVRIRLADAPKSSETERQEFGVTGGVAIDKGTKTNLVDDARSGKSLPRQTDQESKPWRNGH